MTKSITLLLLLNLLQLCLGVELFNKRNLDLAVNISNVAPDICNTCQCIDPVIDCRNKGLSKTNYSWPKWRHSELIFDFNFFSHVTKFPPIPVTNLSLAHNRIKTIDDNAFEDVTFLVQLNLKNNYLADLRPEIFSGHYDTDYYRPLKYLRILDLSHNVISSLHQDLFLHLPNLEILNLSHNPLNILDDNARKTLSKIPFIKVLDLSYTRIGDLPEYFLHNSYYLKVLNLQGNNFTQVPQKFLEDGHSLVNLNLENNPVKSSTTEKVIL